MTLACENGLKGREIFAESAAAGGLSDALSVPGRCLQGLWLLFAPARTPWHRQMAEGDTEGSHPFLAADFNAC